MRLVFFSELKDNYATAEFRADRLEGMPELLKAMINASPNIFNGPSGECFVVFVFAQTSETL